MTKEIGPQSSLTRVVVISLLLAACLVLPAGLAYGQATGGSAAQAACKPDGAAVVRAYRTSRGAPIPAPNQDGATDVQLGDEISVEVSGLPGLAACESPEHPLVLFLNGRPLKKLVREPLSDPRAAIAKFTLKITADSRDTWARVLGRPTFDARPVEVSVGMQDRYQVHSDAKLYLQALPMAWFATWAIIFVVLAASFVYLAFGSNIIRDGQPDPAAQQWTGPYSLSRTQAAWWFFVVLAGYLLIGLVTGDFVGSFNATALGLLGIGAGTVLGSVAIDAAKSGPAAQVAQQQAQHAAENQVTQFTAAATNLRAAADAQPDPQRKTELQQKANEAQGRLEMAQSNQAKLLNQSEGFFKDLVSDGNGVSFHRFQMVAWTLVLAVVFWKQVYENLSMPDFDATLFGLTGLSAGTYLGLKTTEATTPKK